MKKLIVDLVYISIWWMKCRCAGPFYGDKSINEQFNWRIRSGMGDNALS